MHKALFVAVNQNTDRGFSNLPNTLNDINEIRRILTEVPTTFENQNVNEFSGNHATNRILNLVVTDFFSDATEEDILFLFWAGHGYASNGEGYLVPYDGDSLRPDDSMIKMSNVRRWIETSRARVVICFFDTCHSGLLARSGDILRGLQIHGNGKVIFAACQDIQYAYDRNGHGAFTDYLIEGLTGGAADFNGNIDVYTLYSYISTRLTNEFRGEQVPVIHSSLSGSPVVIKRIESRQATTNKKHVITDAYFLLDTLITVYDSFNEEKQSVFRLVLDNPDQATEYTVRELYAKNQRHNSLPFAIRNQAYLVNFSDLSIESSSNGLKMTLELNKVEGKHESMSLGISYGGGYGSRTYTDDDIAKERAKLIIFGFTDATTQNKVSDSILQSFIFSPSNGSIKIDPNSKTGIGIVENLDKLGLDLIGIRVSLVNWLILTGTIEKIEKLVLNKKGNLVDVHLIGYRKKYYTNVDPVRIELIGQVQV
ncbi:caspase domain-containing protein [Paenibacillus aurantiacus]|uniref:Caspase domain-containing protein n=1 Tax=Paenibacillus aurantiacus TaxID=1936118 RepID=A0ABV5KTU6_9BACL